MFGSSPILLEQLLIRILGLRVFIEIFHVRVRRRVVEIKIILLDVLAMVALAASQTKKPFFQDWILAVPEGKGEAQILMPVADTRYAIFVPAVGARASVIMREVIPRVAIGAIVFAHRAPGALGQKRAPTVPVPAPLSIHQ